MISLLIGIHDLVRDDGDRPLTVRDLMPPLKWVPSEERDECATCTSNFSAFKRRHHCRMCGEVVCGSCTVKQPAVMKAMGDCVVRVCRPCIKAWRKKEGGKTGVSLPKPSSEDMTVAVSQAELDDLEGLFSPTNLQLELEFEQPELEPSSPPSRQSLGASDKFIRWDVSSLQVPWYSEEEITAVHRLSADNQSTVWLVSHHGSRLFAAKRLHGPKRTQRAADEFVGDIKLASELKHARVVALVGASWTQDYDLQALYEHMPGGNLRGYLDETLFDAMRNPQRMIQKLRIALDITEALSYVHSLLKPRQQRVLASLNVLLTSDFRAKIGGFGCMRVESAMRTNMATLDVARWLAPEVLNGYRSYGAACDIYSFGIMLSELDTHLVPFSDCRGPQGNVLSTVTLVGMIAQGQIKPTISKGCPPEMRQLATECVAFEPSARPSAIAIMTRLRAFIRSIGLESTLEMSKSSNQFQGVRLF